MCSTPRVSIALKAPSLLPLASNLDSKHFHATFRQSNENIERLQQQREQEFLSQEPDFQRQIDIDSIHCPSHLIQFTGELKKLDAEQTVKVSCSSSALINELAASGRILNFTVKTLRFRRQQFL